MEVDHEVPAGRRGRGRELAGVVKGRRGRLGDQHVVAGAQCVEHHALAVAGLHPHDHRLEVFGLPHLPRVGVPPSAAPERAGSGARLRVVEIAHRAQVDGREMECRIDRPGREDAGADEPDPEGLHRA